MYIWDLTTGEVVFGQRFPSCVSVLQWVEHRMENRRMVYELCLGISSNMIKATFEGLQNMNSPRSIAGKRGKKVADLFERSDEPAAAAAPAAVAVAAAGHFRRRHPSQARRRRLLPPLPLWRRR